MYKWIGVGIIALVVGFGLFVFVGHDAQETPNAGASGDPEERIIAYLRENVRPGQPVLVTELYNNVFTSEEERAALEQLYDKFFMIPAAAAEIQKETGKIPTLQELSDRFQFKVPDTVAVMLRVLESDPRIPPFFDRDPVSGEIIAIYVERIAREGRFARHLRF